MFSLKSPSLIRGGCLRPRQLAEQKKLTLMVDHTFIYTVRSERSKKLVQSGELVTFSTSITFESIWACSSMTSTFCGTSHPMIFQLWTTSSVRKPESVSVVGARHFNNVEDMAYLDGQFLRTILSLISCQLAVTGEGTKDLDRAGEEMIVYDMDPSEKVKAIIKGLCTIRRDDPQCARAVQDGRYVRSEPLIKLKP